MFIRALVYTLVDAFISFNIIREQSSTFNSCTNSPLVRTLCAQPHSVDSKLNHVAVMVIEYLATILFCRALFPVNFTFAVFFFLRLGKSRRATYTIRVVGLLYTIMKYNRFRLPLQWASCKKTYCDGWWSYRRVYIRPSSSYDRWEYWELETYTHSHFVREVTLAVTNDDVEISPAEICIYVRLTRLIFLFVILVFLFSQYFFINEPAPIVSSLFRQPIYRNFIFHRRFSRFANTRWLLLNVSDRRTIRRFIRGGYHKSQWRSVTVS